jgi:hypothetical protein
MAQTQKPPENEEVPHQLSLSGQFEVMALQGHLFFVSDPQGTELRQPPLFFSEPQRAQLRQPRHFSKHSLWMALPHLLSGFSHPQWTELRNLQTRNQIDRNGQTARKIGLRFKPTAEFVLKSLNLTLSPKRHLLQRQNSATQLTVP